MRLPNQTSVGSPRSPWSDAQSPRRPSLRASARTVLAVIATTVALSMMPAHARPAAGAAQKFDLGQWCRQISNRLPGLSSTTCRNSALVSTGARSRNGTPILIRRFGQPARNRDAVRLAGAPATLATPPVRILLLGGIHGDELTSSAIVFQWMQLLHEGQAQNLQWEVVPVLNPDGLMAPKPVRVNAMGVDLNRNFPTPNWAVEAPRYWTKETGSDPRRYPGRAPLSEPETRWVNDEILRFRPNVIISVHAPFNLLDFDGPAPAPKRFGRLTLNPVGVYPGSLGNYSGKFKNVPVITIELPNAMAMPTDAEGKKIWADMLDWINRNVARAAPLG